MCGDRGVLCFDGDYPQIEALLSNENKDSAGRTLRQCFADRNIELVKFSGGCSMSQQPNDRSRCFFCIKAAKKKFVFQDVERIRCTAPDWASKGYRLLKQHKIEASSLRTFEWFLLTWPDLSATAFTPGNIKSGWEKVGLCPFVPEKMMEAWAFLPDFLAKEPEGVAKITALISVCAKVVVETGSLSDEQMDEVFYDNNGLFAFVQHSEPESKKTGDSAPVNHRRCIWMSNPVWMAAEQQRRQLRAEEKRRIEEDKAEKLKQSDAKKAAAADKKATKSSRPAHPASKLDTVNCPCGSKIKNKYAHFDADKHKAWLLAQAIAPPSPVEDAIEENLQGLIIEEQGIADARAAASHSQQENVIASRSDSSSCGSDSDSDDGCSDRDDEAATTAKKRPRDSAFNPTAAEAEFLRIFRQDYPAAAADAVGLIGGVSGEIGNSSEFDLD